MKEKIGVLKVLLQCFAGSSIIFAIVTLLSSTNVTSNEIPTFFMCKEVYL